MAAMVQRPRDVKTSIFAFSFHIKFPVEHF